MKKILLVAVALMATTLLTTNGSATACSGVPVLQFVGTGSSAQFNTFAYAAVNLISGGTFSTSTYNFTTSSTAVLADTRFTTPLNDTGLSVWIAWDNAANCNVYAYFSTDSTVGVKDFFAYKTVSVNAVNFSVAAEYATSLGTAFGQNKVNGLTDTTSTLPSTVNVALTTPPIPSSKTDTPHAHGLNYCGYAGSGGSSKAGVWCYFNAGLTDIRPEDALYATTRALSSIPSAGGLTGLGYNDSACLAGTAPPGTISTQGCPLADSFGKGKLFNVVGFSLTKDPITAAAPPKFQTLSTGAAPIVVFVSHGDTTALGLGATYNDNSSKSHYTFTDINRAVLAKVFDGTLGCTGDLLSGTPKAGNNPYDTGSIAGPPAGAGNPLQVVLREPLSGTYNTMEFTGVRTLANSSNAATAKPSTTAWISSDDSGQEFSPLLVAAPEGNVYANNPATSFSAGGCPTVTLSAGASSAPTAGSTCGDPLFMPTTHACGSGLRLRAIGTGEAVQAGSGQINSGGSVVTDGIAYAFWSYGNFGSGNKIVSACVEQANGTCLSATNHGHYLTVDSVDPLFNTAGGEFDNSYSPGILYQNGSLVAGTSGSNPAGAFNLPQCGFNFFTADSNGNTESCLKIPFTHIYDGTYPLWSLLRVVTMTNTGSGASQTLAVPAGVINMVAAAEAEAADQDNSGVKKELSDFVPLLALDTTQTWTVTNPYIQGGASTTLPTGALSLGVFRSHYKQTNNPLNGHIGCTTFSSGIAIGASTGCLLDGGGDVGGSVFTVQGDVDFNSDYGSLTGYPKEIYTVRQ